MRCKIDWEKAKNEYITGKDTLVALGKKYGVSRKQMHTKSSKEGWVQARKDYRTNKATKVIKTFEKAQVKAEVNRLEDVQAAGLKGVSMIRAMIERNEELQSSDTFDPRDLNALARALKDFTAVIKEAYGLMSPAEIESLKIARERLELDRQKAHQFDTDDSESGVVIIPEVDIHD